ncbi:hypothetical protein PQG46_08555 [Aquirufa nivalisilvae]
MRYLVEYEFETDFGNRYWFPLFITAENETLAEFSAKTAQTAIEEKYKRIRRTKVQRIVNSINAEYLSEYVKNRLTGKLQILEFAVWRFTDLTTNPELSFNEHIELIESSDIILSDFIAKTVSRHRFPVRVIKNNSLIDFDEFLLVNVVDPSNTDGVT